jgi:predicted aconitase
MHLTAQEEAMLNGDRGEATRKAIEIVVALGRIYGAQELVPVASVQVAGVSYGNLGEAGLEFIREWAGQGARVQVPTTLNPAGMDLEAWRELGIPEQYAERQSEIIKTYQAMGIAPVCSCTPYLSGNQPTRGQHIAWSESSAVSYANSVLGARTNREGGPSALAAAISGRTAKYGLHLGENRLAHHRIQVKCPVGSIADFGALGYIVGKRVGDGVPYFHLNSAARPDAEALKALGAAMAASGAVALYHIDRVTPEATAGKALAEDATRTTIDSLEEGYQALNSPVGQIDLVWIGCPHASLAEIERVAALLNGRRVKAPLWVTTARQVMMAAGDRGLLHRIETSGGKVVADACLIGAPLQEMGFSRLATNSGKGAFYLLSHLGLQVRFGPLTRCVEAAVKGRWPG